MRWGQYEDNMGCSTNNRQEIKSWFESTSVWIPINIYSLTIVCISITQGSTMWPVRMTVRSRNQTKVNLHSASSPSLWPSRVREERSCVFSVRINKSHTLWYDEICYWKSVSLWAQHCRGRETERAFFYYCEINDTQREFTRTLMMCSLILGSKQQMLIFHVLVLDVMKTSADKQIFISFYDKNIQKKV